MPGKLLLLGRAGSHSYGTAIEGSDEDFRGIFVHKVEDYLLFKEPQDEFTRSTPYDIVIYDIKKFFKLAVGNNPNILEFLFLDKDDIVYAHPAYDYIRSHRSAFITTKVKQTFSGYARAQMHRMKGHYHMLHNPKERAPTRSDFGLPDAPVIPKEQRDALLSLIENKVVSWAPELTGLDDAGRIAIQAKYLDTLEDIGVTSLEDLSVKSLNLTPDMLKMLKGERAFKAAVKEWRQYQDWKTNRNQKRAVLEAKVGYDVKHAMHLVRLLDMCLELLTTGEMSVRRPNAEYLLRIRNGEFSYEEIISIAEKLSDRVEVEAERSKLPHEVSENYVRNVIVYSIEHINGKSV